MGHTIAPGFLSSLFCSNTNWSLEFHEHDLSFTLVNDCRTELKASALAKARVVRGIFWANIVITTGNEEWVLGGISNSVAFMLTQKAQNVEARLDALKRERAELDRMNLERQRVEAEHKRQLRLTFLEKEIDSLMPGIAALRAEVDRMSGTDKRYVRTFDIRRIRRDNAEHFNSLSHLIAIISTDDLAANRWSRELQAAKQLQDFFSEDGLRRKSWNAAFVKDELQDERWSQFFHRVERNKLSDEQAIAIITHEDANLLIAAAGSGKTSTLVAKAGYAVAKGYVEPNEILALAFNEKAAAEIKARIKERLNIRVEARTFHSHGNQVVEQATGARLKPNLTMRFDLTNAMAEVVQRDRAFAMELLFFKAVHWEREPDQQFASAEEYEQYIRSVGRQESRDGRGKETWGLKSLRGEAVRSYEELSIANWLFVNGVDYGYEEFYEHDVNSLGWEKYQPDFMYVRSDGSRLYHEHFALTSDQTSPFGKRYIQGVNDKRNLHVRFGTTLIETTSAQFASGTVFDDLKRALAQFGIITNPISPQELHKVLHDRNDRDLVELMVAVISHSKEANLGENELRASAAGQANAVRAQAFINLLLPVWREYEACLKKKGQLDFADMIGRATKLIREGKYQSQAKLILVDEFQDISQGRAEFVQALLDLHDDAVLFAVGDDWQAINRFAGSDLSIMREFESRFGKSELLKLTQTFRSNQGITNVASKFVMRNPLQFEKTVTSRDKTGKGVVRIVEHRDKDLLVIMEAKLDEIAELAVVSYRQVNVMIIGRYQYDTAGQVSLKQVVAWNAKYAGKITIATRFDAKKKSCKPLDSIHKAKGLEADFVLVYGLQSERNAFPYERTDDPILKIVQPAKESYEFAEERRLFYVALTRAREQVILFVPESRPSRFALELLDDAYGEEVVFEGEKRRPIACTWCKRGRMKRRRNTKTGIFFYGCTQYKPDRLGCTNTLDLWQVERRP